MLFRSSLQIVSAVLVLAMVLLANPAAGQSFYGSIVGTVTDPQGSVLPGAAIVATNNGTGERRNVQSAEDGSFRFLNLVPGNYRLEIQATGFQRYVRDQIEVNVEASVRADAVLQVGNVEQTVEVTAEIPQLQTESAAVGAVVASRAVQEQPLNGRNVLNLVSLVPGVVPQGSSDGSMTGKNVYAGGNYQIGGGTANQSATYFDGVPLNATYGNIVVLTPSPDAVSEFKVQTSSNSAEFGRFTGGVINIASRSGSNSFHGGLYEYHRNKVLNANTFFGNRAGLERPPFVQNQFGGYLGGPVVKDKTFFFFSYEGYRNREGVLFRRTVPTPEMRNGDFSNYRNAAGKVIPIYDPWTQCGTVNHGTGLPNPACGPGIPNRLQFPGNVIPQNRISPIARKFLGFPIYADPTVAGPWKPQNFETNAATGGDNDQINVRGDQNISDNQRLLLRYTRWRSQNLPVDVYGNGETAGDPYSPEAFVTTQAMLAHTYTLNTTTLIDVRIGYVRWDYSRTPGNVGIDIPGTFGLPASPFGELSARNRIDNSSVVPGINAGVNTAPGGGLYNIAVDNTYVITPTLTKVAGAHTLKFGAELRRGEIHETRLPGPSFTFSSAPTALDGTNPGATGDGFASFLLGQPTGGSLSISPFTSTNRRYQGYFVNDTWQTTPKLTTTLGLRWEIPGVPVERFDRQVTFDPNMVNPVLTGMTNPETGKPYQGAFVLVNSAGHPERGLRPEKYGLLAPRVGLAYRLADRTVVRAGAGIYYVPENVNRFQNPSAAGINVFVNNLVTSVDQNRTFFTGLDDPFPFGIQNAPGRDPVFQQALLGGSARANLREEDFPGYTQQWNLAVQHQFSNGISVEAAYTGLRGVHLQTSIFGLEQARLGKEYIDRAANDPTRCNLVNNNIIPDLNGSDTCYGWYLRQQVPNPFSGIITAGPLATPTIQRGMLFRPHPQYESAARDAYVGSSSYHALQLKADKRFTRGGMISGNYTFSKNVTNAESLTSWLETDGSGLLPPQGNDFSQEWALSAFDARHRAVISYVLDLPFGRGRAFFTNASSIVEKLTSGWALNGNVTFQAGYPLGFTATPNLTGFGIGTNYITGFGLNSLRPNVLPNCEKQVGGSAQDRLDGWFNTACFSVPGRWGLGNHSRTDPELRGHGINNWNMGLTKTTAISERLQMTFRAEAFNLFNRVQFSRPNTQASTLANNQFGVVTGQNNQPRLFQLALRLSF